ncbi:MAG TPA: hypothetical protein VKE41_00960 [Roseiflexaceae bacterium]|nr:hypothetical protein [Roseiflexaceae bacterium]
MSMIARNERFVMAAALVALILSTMLGTFVVYDGESIWLESVALIGLYGMIAASFWWG